MQYVIPAMDHTATCQWESQSHNRSTLYVHHMGFQPLTWQRRTCWVHARLSFQKQKKGEEHQCASTLPQGLPCKCNELKELFGHVPQQSKVVMEPGTQIANDVQVLKQRTWNCHLLLQEKRQLCQPIPTLQVGMHPSSCRLSMTPSCTD